MSTTNERKKKEQRLWIHLVHMFEPRDVVGHVRNFVKIDFSELVTNFKSSRENKSFQCSKILTLIS